MDYQLYVESLDNQTVAKLKEAVETGKWENGDKLNQQQLESAMQAIMLWQASNEIVSEDEPFKVNHKGEFSLGKSGKLKEVPLEFQTVESAEDKGELIFTTKVK